jgi:hypothetical protein
MSIHGTCDGPGSPVLPQGPPSPTLHSPAFFIHAIKGGPSECPMFGELSSAVFRSVVPGVARKSETPSMNKSVF